MKRNLLLLVFVGTGTQQSLDALALILATVFRTATESHVVAHGFVPGAIGVNESSDDTPAEVK